MSETEFKTGLEQDQDCPIWLHHIMKGYGVRTGNQFRRYIVKINSNFLAHGVCSPRSLIPCGSFLLGSSQEKAKGDECELYLRYDWGKTKTAPFGCIASH